MISNPSLGYIHNAPDTLAIRGLEGVIVGYLGTRAFPTVSQSMWRAITITIGLLFATALAFVGSVFRLGNFAVALGGAWYIPAITLDYVPWLFWLVLVVVAFAVIAAPGLRLRAKSRQSLMSVLARGSEIDAGYCLYESFVLTLIAPASVVAALAPVDEVPINMARALVGLLATVPLVQHIKEVTGGRGLLVPAGDSK